MTAIGICTNTSNKCLSNTFCPATTPDEVNCQPCDDSITTGNGCNCTDNTPIKNCMSCDATKCTKCISGFVVKTNGASCDSCSANCSTCTDKNTCTECNPGFYVENSKCVKCSKNCLICLSVDVCTSCIDNFTLQDNNCLQKCDSTVKCALPSNFCDIATSTCRKCAEGCLKCKSEQLCGVCAGSKQPNIYGICEDSCTGEANPKVGEYCKGGKAVECGVGITQECQCSGAKNCAGCQENGKACRECLPGYEMKNGLCLECSEGFEEFVNSCVKMEQEEAVRMSGGAIAGVVIGVLVVVGGVIGGIAYCLVKKSKKQVVQPEKIQVAVQ